MQRSITIPEEKNYDLHLDWSKSHIFWGEAGCGKTIYALQLMPKALFVTHMDDLVQFDATEHDGIIFDDMSFDHLHREAQIHIVDIDFPRSIHVRYQVAHIPPNTKKIFTTNKQDGAIFLTEDLAIKRRIKIHHLIKP